jgi:hypothetical protein
MHINVQLSDPIENDGDALDSGGNRLPRDPERELALQIVTSYNATKETCSSWLSLA